MSTRTVQCYGACGGRDYQAETKAATLGPTPASINTPATNNGHALGSMPASKIAPPIVAPSLSNFEALTNSTILGHLPEQAGNR